jgi:hypothetical protein
VLLSVLPDETARVQALADANTLFKAYRIHRKTYRRGADDSEMMLDAFREETEKHHGAEAAQARAK